MRSIYIYVLFTLDNHEINYTEALSISAAHNAAPTVFVNENAMDAKGTISRRKAVTPKLNHPEQVSK